jgi:hypothetical protein
VCIYIYIYVQREVEHVWWRGEVYAGCWWGILRGRGHLEDPDVDGRIILKWIFMKWVGGMDWIDLLHDRDR